jgi:hypothetical protein
MSYQLSPTNRVQVVSPVGRFTVAVEGDFRGGQLHVLFSIDGEFASRATEGIHIFDASDVRTFDANGEDVKLLWVGDAGAVNVTLTESSQTVSVPELAAVTNDQDRLLVEPLGQPSVARQLAAGAASANTPLTTTCRRISVRAVGADIRYMIGAAAQTANADTSHFIANDERLDLAVPASANIAVIRDATTDGVLELTELI